MNNLSPMLLLEDTWRTCLFSAFFDFILLRIWGKMPLEGPSEHLPLLNIISSKVASPAVTLNILTEFSPREWAQPQLVLATLPWRPQTLKAPLSISYIQNCSTFVRLHRSCIYKSDWSNLQHLLLTRRVWDNLLPVRFLEIIDDLRSNRSNTSGWWLL